MAKEDLLANLLVNLTTAESNSTQTDDNTLIQKMIAPNDSAQIADNLPTLALLTPSTFVWGGYVGATLYNPNWNWGQGQWK